MSGKEWRRKVSGKEEEEGGTKEVKEPNSVPKCDLFCS